MHDNIIIHPRSHAPTLTPFTHMGRKAPGWYNPGYIFPEGFESRVSFRSSVALDQLCVHECSVTGRGGQFWPGPTFRVRAMDRADEPITAKSCTGCWTAVRVGGGRGGGGESVMCVCVGGSGSWNRLLLVSSRGASFLADIGRMHWRGCQNAEAACHANMPAWGQQ